MLQRIMERTDLRIFFWLLRAYADDGAGQHNDSNWALGPRG